MIDNDLKFYRSKTVTNEASNGGRISYDLIPSGVEQNVWPNVYRDERLTGSTRFVKLFLKAGSALDEALKAATAYLFSPTAADDWVSMFLATDTDEQSDITGAEPRFGTGILKTDAAADEMSMVVTLEDESLVTGAKAIFRDGDTVTISNKTTPDGVSGTTETKVISSFTTSGVDVTLTFSKPLLNSYVAGACQVSSVLQMGDISPTTEAFVVSAAGTLTYDSATYPPILTNNGAETQVFTLTFIDAVNFNVTGDSLIDLPSGNTGANYVAPNPNAVGFNYLELNMLGFGGTPQAGDTITITIKHACQAVWLERVIPPNSGSLSNNRSTTVFTGESI